MEATGILPANSNMHSKDTVVSFAGLRFGVQKTQSHRGALAFTVSV
jgi:hypothetical protein